MQYLHGQALTARQEFQVALEHRIATVSQQDATHLQQANAKLKAELSRVSHVLSRLNAPDRQRVMYVMTQEMEILAYQIAVAAADIATKPIREEALQTRNMDLLDDAEAIFEQLVG